MLRICKRSSQIIKIIENIKKEKISIHHSHQYPLIKKIFKRNGKAASCQTVTEKKVT